MQLATLSWEQIAEYLARDNRVILPIGATEQHGRHLGVGADYLIAQGIAEKIGAQTRVLVAPTLAYGMSHQHLEFSGTLSLSPATLSAVLQDLLQSLYRHGFRRVLVVNGHGGNQPALQSAVATVQQLFPDLRVKSFQWWLEPEVVRIVDDALGAQRGTHASNHETAFMAAIAPDGVHPTRIAPRDAPVVASREMDSPTRFREKYPDGVMGLAPPHADAALGAKLLAASGALGIQEIENW
jgi:creatinine amidohydrolase